MVGLKAYMVTQIYFLFFILLDFNSKHYLKWISYEHYFLFIVRNRVYKFTVFTLIRHFATGERFVHDPWSLTRTVLDRGPIYQISVLGCHIDDHDIEDGRGLGSNLRLKYYSLSVCTIRSRRQMWKHWWSFEDLHLWLWPSLHKMSVFVMLKQWACSYLKIHEN